MGERKLTNLDRKIRLSQYDRDRLYSRLLEDSGILDRIRECQANLSKIAEQLFLKYIIPDALGDCYPGCERLSATMDYIYIYFNKDFDICYPNFNEKVDLVKPIVDAISVKFSKEYPKVLIERSWNKNDNPEFRFAGKIKKLASKGDLMLLETALVDLVDAHILKATYLKELRTFNPRSWRGACNLGKFFNLGALYDYNQEWGYIMKYDIMKLVDEDETKEPNNNLRLKDADGLSLNEHVEALRRVLGF